MDKYRSDLVKLSRGEDLRLFDEYRKKIAASKADQTKQNIVPFVVMLSPKFTKTDLSKIIPDDNFLKFVKKI